MKINNTNKINSFFNNVKIEAIHNALKNNNYKGIRRDQIENLLKTKNIDEVYKILKLKYKKKNFLLVYFFILLTSILGISSIIGYQIYQNENFQFQKYILLENYNSFLIIDYFLVTNLLILTVFLILFVYEIIIYFRYKK